MNRIQLTTMISKLRIVLGAAVVAGAAMFVRRRASPRASTIVTTMKEELFIPFRLHGLQVTDDPCSTNLKLFNGVSVVSGRAVKEFFQGMPFAVGGGGGQSDRVIDLTVDDDAAYLLVRTYGEDAKVQVENASIRASEVVSVLWLMMMVRTYYHESLCLDEQVLSYPSTRKLLVSNQVGVRLWGDSIATRALIHVIPQPPIRASQAQLREWLTHPAFHALTVAVLDRSKTTTRKMQEHLAQVSVLLYETVNTVMPETQVLGAVTTLESLTSFRTGEGNRQTWDQTERQLTVLLGEQRFNLLAPLLKVRHKFVHEGRRCTKEDARIAIRVAVGALLTYARLAPSYDSHNDLVQHLQFSTEVMRYKGDRYEPARKLAAETHGMWCDTLPFDIVRFTIGATGLDPKLFGVRPKDIPESELMALKQAEAVATTSLLLEANLHEAYDAVMRSLTYEVPEWNNFKSFDRYYRSRQARIDSTARETADLFRQFESTGIELSGRNSASDSSTVTSTKG